MKLEPKAFLCKSDIGTEHLRFFQPDGVDAEPLYAIPPGYVLVEKDLLIRTMLFLAQDCTPCAADECQIDGKNINVDLLVKELQTMLSAAKEK